MSDDRGQSEARGTIVRAVPLFPLPNVVLFPRCVLPLHIFEQRYKAMTVDALKGNKQIAMALLKSGWEKSYYGTPAIEPIVCIGTILTHERLADGKYNFLLQGESRARIIQETASPNYTEYRTADLEVMIEAPVMEIDLLDGRRRLISLMSDPLLGKLPLIKQFQQMLSSALPTRDIADLIAFNLLDDVQTKQSLLAEPDPRRRVNQVIAAIESLRPPVQMVANASLFDPSAN